MLNKVHVDNVILPNDIDLNTIANETWAEIVSLCPQLPTNPRINIFFDYLLENTTILAYASQTLHLSSNGFWISKIYEAMIQQRNTSLGAAFDMNIAFNPYPPNGWFVHKDCSNISARYDLRTVLRHELLHGLIFAGSVREENSEWIAGYAFNGKCYPRLYDTKIKFSDNTSIFHLEGNNLLPVVGQCALRNDKTVEGADLFIGDVQLYHPYYYRPGSTISHHNYPKDLMYASTTPMVCKYLGEYEFKVMAEFGIQCNLGKSSSGTKNMYLGVICWSIIILILSY